VEEPPADNPVVAHSKRIFGGGFDSLSPVVCIRLALRLRSIPTGWCVRRFVVAGGGFRWLVVDWEVVPSCDGVGSAV